MRWWMGRFTVSYFTTALFVLVGGFFLGLSVEAVLTDENAPSFLIDGCFLLLLANLALNWTSTGYVYVGDDSFSRRVSFLRSLPTAARDVVGMRLIVLLATLLVMTPLAFVPPYLIFDAMRETFGLYQYLCFVLIWASYGLVCGCANAYLELGLPAKSMLVAQMLWVIPLIALIALASASGVGIVERSIRLALSHGTLAAGVALVVGASGAYAWFRLAERRLRGRELVS